MTAADRLAAIRAHATDPSYGPVPGAEVVWLCDEVERLREALGTCYSDECREPCQSQQRRARAELHEARAELAKVSTRLGEARRALAYLRGRIEALARDGEADGRGNSRDLAHRLRAALADVATDAPDVAMSPGRDNDVAGSGEQPGEGLTLPGGLPPSPYYRPAPSTTTEGGS